VNFIIDNVAPWIIERGGWVSLIFMIKTEKNNNNLQTIFMNE